MRADQFFQPCEHGRETRAAADGDKLQPALCAGVQDSCAPLTGNDG